VACRSPKEEARFPDLSLTGLGPMGVVGMKGDLVLAMNADQVKTITVVTNNLDLLAARR